MPTRVVSRRWIAALLLALLPTGCHEFNDRSATMPADGEELPILRQVSGAHGREDRPLLLVIRDAATLAQVPLADVTVDFSSEMLLIVSLGRQTWGVPIARVQRVWREGPVLRVDYQITADTTNTSTNLSTPYCIAVVPRCDLNVKDFSSTVPYRRERKGAPSYQPQTPTGRKPKQRSGSKPH